MTPAEVVAELRARADEAQRWAENACYRPPEAFVAPYTAGEVFRSCTKQAAVLRDAADLVERELVKKEDEYVQVGWRESYHVPLVRRMPPTEYSIPVFARRSELGLAALKENE